MNHKKLIIILIIAGFSLYFLSLFNDFVWDDEEQVVNNTAIHSLTNIPQLFKGSTFNTGGTGGLSGVYYKPLMSVVFMVIYALFGLNAFYFHLFQVLIHVINTVLVFLILKNLFNKYVRNNKKDTSTYKWAAFGIALIFLVHPVNVETVVYVSALQDVLFFFFGILALYIITNNLEIAHFAAINKFKITPLILLPLLLFFSILSKETAIVFIFIIFIYLLLFDKEKVKKFLIYIFIMLGLYILLRIGIAKVYFTKSGIVPIMRVALYERLITIPRIILFYIKNFFYPKDLIISQHWIVKEIDWKDFYLPLIIVIAFFTLLITYAISLFKRNKRLFKLYIFFLSWFLTGLGLHLQIFSLDMTVADRWFYLPMIGLLGTLSLIIVNTFDFKNIRIKSLSSFIFGTIIILFTYRSLLRTLDWSNGLVLFSHDQKINQNAFDLENNLGVELYRNGRITEAKSHFEKSTKLASYWWTNWNNLGAVYEEEGDLKKAEEYYKKSIENGDYYLAYMNYAEILIKQERYDEANDFLVNNALLKFPYNERLNMMYYYLNNKQDKK